MLLHMNGKVNEVHHKERGCVTEGALVVNLLLDMSLEAPVPFLPLTQIVDEVDLGHVSPHPRHLHQFGTHGTFYPGKRKLATI